tara:strand:+ start:945 stop:1310 length:366 start_codon:yes stop_codon:yes gene_type:complete
MATVNLDTAVRLDIVCRRRDSFKLEIDFGTQAATDGNWVMQVRDSVEGTIRLDGFSFSSSDGAATSSKLTIEASAAEMNIPGGMYVYDLQNTNSHVTIDGAHKVQTHTFGTFKVVDDITFT